MPLKASTGQLVSGRYRQYLSLWVCTRIYNWVFSERELKFMFAMSSADGGPSVVCRLSSVTLVHPTQAIEIFGNISSHVAWPSVTFV